MTPLRKFQEALKVLSEREYPGRKNKEIKATIIVVLLLLLLAIPLLLGRGFNS